MGELGSQGYRHKGQTGRRRKEGWQRQEVKEKGGGGRKRGKERARKHMGEMETEREEASRQREAGDRDGERVKIAPH